MSRRCHSVAGEWKAIAGTMDGGRISLPRMQRGHASDWRGFFLPSSRSTPSVDARHLTRWRNRAAPGPAPVHGPLVLRFGTGSGVELDGRGVPVQHRPFETAAALGHGLARDVLQQCLAGARTALFLADVEVFQVDALAAQPGGIV